jgi:hypothetical protein
MTGALLAIQHQKRTEKGVDGCRRWRYLSLGQRKTSNKRVGGRVAESVLLIFDKRSMSVAIITLLLSPRTSYSSTKKRATNLITIGSIINKAFNNKRGLCIAARKGVARCSQVSIFCDSGTLAD